MGTMFSEHEPFCDQSHTMRQRCNDRLRVEAAAEAAAFARLAAESPVPSSNGTMHDAAPAEPAALAEPAVAPAPDAPPARQREAVVASVEVPEPTPYVTREWARTAAAVEGHEAGGRYDLDPVSDRRDRSALRIAVIAWAAIAIVWLLMRRRPRPDEA
jgi:hypothetical protein